ncbi:hypothetical protein SUGI_0499170, partial [Cryptomeria japonica]
QYLTPNECLQCFTAAKAKVKEFCPKSNGAKIHLDGCFLRFENNTFFDGGEDGGDDTNCSTVSETVDFSNTAYGLLSRLIQNASTNDGYAVGSLNSIYALVQCVKSLNNDTCQSCLRDARELLTTNCFLTQEAHALMAGCFIRYANYPFFSHNLTDIASAARGLRASSLSLPKQIWQLYESEQILEMVDPKLKGEYPQEQMVRVIRIALLCVKESPSQRPSMTQIVSMLTSNSEITDQPTKPAFLESNVNDRTPTSSSRDSAGSHGSVTVSLFAR